MAQVVRTYHCVPCVPSTQYALLRTHKSELRKDNTEIIWAMYKYTLEKYSGPGSRHTCPGCGRKREFTRYVDAVTGEPLSPLVGKCNRSSRCKYHYTPSQYFADHPHLGNPSHTLPYHSKPVPKTTPASAAPAGTIDRQYLIRSTGTRSHFITWLSRYFGRETIWRVINEYSIGCTKDGRTIFWQQDAEGKVRTGQVMRYDSRTGRRSKGSGVMDWIHAILKRKEELPVDFNLRQCLFGEHLLGRNPDATVVLVESAKSAVICSALLPQFLWCATVGKAGFSPERCRTLTGRKVVIIADADAHEEWLAKAPMVANPIGYEIAVSDFLVRRCTADQRDTGYDIADYIIDQLADGIPHEYLADKIRSQLETYFIPDRLAELIARCLKEPFKK